MVFVIVAVFSRPSTGINTTNDADASRKACERTEPADAQ
jgi:hypothetical protein